ncbi:hypothetical protein V494_01021 [Pseudogymnoascus sp. VKM F-4513 (FW-928)]|nr:hypothetical protein V494_01021 [Pseudogymnoascus sp. VKM F-4513 (FW-928)]
MSSYPVVDGVQVLVPPPPGVTPNFDHPRQHLWLAHYLVFGIGAPLAFLALCQRLYTKLFLTKARRLQMDDFHVNRNSGDTYPYEYLLSLCQDIFADHTAADSVVVGGLCAHVWEMPLTRFEQYSIAIYVAAPMYQLCNGFTKLSLLMVYIKLSPQRWFRIGVWFTIIVVSLYTSIISLLMFFHCHPVQRAYDFKILQGNCLDVGGLYIATAVSNIITDLMLFFLPTPMVLKLKMDKGQKVACILIFGLASLTIATSIGRLVYLPATIHSTDISWDAAPANVWTFAEGNLFVICGSVPTMRRFFLHFFPNMFHSHGATYEDWTDSQPSSNNSRSWPWRRSRGEQSQGGQPQNGQSQHERSPEAIDLHSFSGNSEQRNMARPLSSSAVVTSSGDVDDHSERAILQTMSYTVHSEPYSPAGSLDVERSG